MTNKEFFQAVLDSDLSQEVKDKAQHFMTQLSKQDEKRNTKKEGDNALKTQIYVILKSYKKAQARATASEIAAKVGVSTSKASYLLRVMAENGEIERFEPTKKGAPLEYVAK